MLMHNTAQATVAAFLGAFSRYDVEGMLQHVDETATAFLPVEHHTTQLMGKREIGSAFAAVVERMRASGTARIVLKPEDMILQEWGETAVASFHLRTDHLSRRTFVLRRRETQWLIMHVHASNGPLHA
jgi:ketosteroid isomerase-like protein